MAEAPRMDRRLTPARPDLAAASLRGKVTADRFVEPTMRRIVLPSAPMRRAPDCAAPYDTELLFGEPVAVYEISGIWAWGQSTLDGYVGYISSAALGVGHVPSHRIVTLNSQLYTAPVLKSPPIGALGFGARVAVTATEGDFAQLASGAWLPADHLRPMDMPETDWVAVAERFLGVPYVWGGRSSAGLDCSALVQLSRQAAGFTCQRDTDMQCTVGETIADGEELRRGDLIFWKGHVGIMLDGERLLHATAYTMQALIEPLATARARIEKNEFGAIQRIARLDRRGD
ncbi:C40 family peptidase [Rhodobacteraceae bacterium NNCM2]|nr:C40 family peptidase [Coraliihabitans acroporae]